MSSMFDGLTVSAPGMGADSSGAYGYASPTSEPGVASLPIVPGAGSTPSGAMPATVTCGGSSGLIARVDSSEFLKLVSQAPATIVLYTAQAKSGAQRIAVDRYVASIGGIVFISHASTALRFPPNVRVVAASAVLCEGRPLSNEDFM